LVVTLCSEREELGDICAHQLASVEAMGIPVQGPSADLSGFDLLLDALLGYNSKGNPREPTASLISRANASHVPILAVDIPSGLDPTSGVPGEPTIVATATLTLGLPKTGFLNQASRKFVGNLFLGDVSIPGKVYEGFHQSVPLFRGERVIRIW